MILRRRITMSKAFLWLKVSQRKRLSCELSTANILSRWKNECLGSKGESGWSTIVFILAYKAILYSCVPETNPSYLSKCRPRVTPAITVPLYHFRSLEEYLSQASPICELHENRPCILFFTLSPVPGTAPGYNN